MSVSKTFSSDVRVNETSGDSGQDVLREWTDSLGRSQAILSQSSERSAVEFRAFQEIEARLNRRCADLEAEVAGLRLKAARNVQIEEENRVLRQLYDAQETLQELAAQERAHLEAREAAVTEHETRMRVYAETLNQEKAWIRESSQLIEREIRSATSLHPLRDYLALTEREVARVDHELKRMPGSDKKRPQLEDCLTQLQVQKEFLRSVIDASSREIAEQADTVLKIIQDDRSAPLPPPRRQ